MGGSTTSTTAPLVIDDLMTDRGTDDIRVRGDLAAAPSLASVSTFPPTVCGIATYTSSLLGALAVHRRSADRLTVVSLVDHATCTGSDGAPASPEAAPPAVAEHQRGDGASLDRTTALLDGHDVVSIQHEFGIYGGPDGSEVTALIDAVSVPTLVTFHTVLREPTDRQRAIVAHLARRSDRSIVMSRAAAQRLTTYYAVPPDRIQVIPHGFHARIFGHSATAAGARPLALTWGLIGPGKGLEVAIEAFALLTDLDPLPRYRITGATHPGVVASTGETYRDQLQDLVAARCPEGMIEFDDRYLDRDSLHRQIQAANLIVLPYLSTEQVTSGVLVEAIGAGKPVVSTRFPHAVEVLASGAGIVVPQDDPVALAGAIRTVVSDPRAARTMGQVARSIARDWTWPVVSARFDALVRSVASGHTRASRARHIVRSGQRG